MLTKKCCRCGEVKSTSSFSNNSAKKDKLQDWCKTCCSVNNKQYNKNRKSHYIYVINRHQEALYVGACSYVNTRVSNHINGYVDTTRDYMLSGEWTSIYYISVAEYVSSKLEREFLEYAIIELILPKLNKMDRDIELNNSDLEEKLMEVAQDIIDLNLFEIYKTNNNKGENADMYYIDENNIDDYADDLSNFINMYVAEEENQEEWE